MTLTKFAIFDSKVGSSLPPFYAANRPTGLRNWHFNVNREGSDYNNYPGDYTLFELGVYECDTMDEVPHEEKINHGLAILQIEDRQ